MSDESKSSDAKTSAVAVIVGEVIKAAGSTPEAKEAGSNLGKTAVTVTKALNNVLLPLAAVNFAFDKARDYFQNKFGEELAEKTSRIPKEDLIEPKGSVAGPALQALAFSHDEPNLKQLYLNLLSTSMNRQTAESAHPAFVEIIRQLSSDEAHLIQGLLRGDGVNPIVRIKVQKKGSKGYQIKANNVLIYTDNVNKPIEDPRLPSMVDNWVRLGLVEVSYSLHLTHPKAYDWVRERPEYISLEKSINKDMETVDFDKGSIRRTALGKNFATTVGIV